MEIGDAEEVGGGGRPQKDLVSGDRLVATYDTSRRHEKCGQFSGLEAFTRRAG